MDNLITIPTANVMASPDTLLRLARTHFALNELPTPASLALAMGFATVPQMIKAATDEDYPFDSRQFFSAALTQLEDELSRGGLTERTHAACTKFIRAARLNGVEPRTAQEDKQPIQINILGVGNTNIETYL